jgi:hypothetical protein
MKTTKIECDQCGTDISTTGPHPAFRLALSVEALPSTSEMTYSVMVSPPLGRTHHFCRLGCLVEWAKTL